MRRADGRGDGASGALAGQLPRRGNTGVADTVKNGVGGSAGLRPHELLEAAVASCMTISARRALAGLGAADARVGVRVHLEREEAVSRFRYELVLDPSCEAHRAAVMDRLRLLAGAHHPRQAAVLRAAVTGRAGPPCPRGGPAARLVGVRAVTRAARRTGLPAARVTCAPCPGRPESPWGKGGRPGAGGCPSGRRVGLFSS